MFVRIDFVKHFSQGMKEYVQMEPVVLDQNGYVMVYVSNESDALNWVHFDDFTITHSKTPIVQVDDYYPFGLTFNSFTRNYSEPQRYKYNGKEEQEDWGSGVLDYGAKMYMADIGRWGVVDPMTDQRNWVSPYNYVQNNPLLRIDPDGMFDIISIDKENGQTQITKDEGDDVVQLVDKGEVVDSYTYGENGSFVNDTDIYEVGGHTAVSFTDNKEKADTFFEFAAKSDVEFQNIEVEKAGKTYNIVDTSHDKSTVKNATQIIKILSENGYEGTKISHSHPSGNSIPSGHYGYVKGNPKSLMPVPESSKYNKGDAPSARQISKMRGFKNTKFEVYNPKDGSRTSFDGVNRAVINKNR